MKLAKFTLDILQALLFCVAVACAPLVTAADNPTGSSVGHQLVDINAADAMTIAEVMDGVGVVKAEAIVAHRELVGKFQSLDQLLEVSGIGPATLEKNRHKLTIATE
jgi:competence protein ComEA